MCESKIDKNIICILSLESQLLQTYSVGPIYSLTLDIHECIIVYQYSISLQVWSELELRLTQLPSEERENCLQTST